MNTPSRLITVALAAMTLALTGAALAADGQWAGGHSGGHWGGGGQGHGRGGGQGGFHGGQGNWHGGGQGGWHGGGHGDFRGGWRGHNGHFDRGNAFYGFFGLGGLYWPGPFYAYPSYAYGYYPAPAYVAPDWAQSVQYYCPNVGYYPYIPACPQGWVRVIPAPPYPAQ
jgi:hypothetical protein